MKPDRMLEDLLDPTQGAWLIVALVLLLLTQMVINPRQGRRHGGVLVLSGGAIGLTVAILGAAPLAGYLGWRPIDEIGQERHYRPKGLEGAPVLLFIGSSFTQLGLDMDLVNRRLAEAGVKTRVMARGAGGASRLEQWRYIEESLALLDAPPEMVFMEVSHSYDERPIYALKNSMSYRTLDQFDWRGGLWAFKALLSDETALKGMEDRWKAAGEVVDHMVVRTFDVGLIHRVRPSPPRAPVSPYHPRTEPKPNYDPADTTQQLEAEAWELNGTPPSVSGPNRWAMGFYDNVGDLLAARGVKTFGFYAMPHAAISMRRYAKRFCAVQAEKGRPCLNANARSVIDHLGPDFWIDRAHLRVNGARYYSEWLADRLIEEGLAR